MKAEGGVNNPIHPLAELFPAMADAEIADLANDIGARGLLHPIVLFEDKILDGRNRAAACKRAGVEPKFTTYEGNDPVGFVLAANLHRRHLTESQRAMVASKLATLQDGQRQVGQLAHVPTMAEAAARLGVGARSVKRARKVAQTGVPELVAAVNAGDVKVSAAAVVADLPVEEQKAIVSKGASAVAKAAAQRRDRGFERRLRASDVARAAAPTKPAAPGTVPKAPISAPAPAEADVVRKALFELLEAIADTRQVKKLLRGHGRLALAFREAREVFNATGRR